MPGELIGELCNPNCLIIPVNSTVSPTLTGQIYLSGTSIVWFDGSSVQTLSGSNTGD